MAPTSTIWPTAPPGDRRMNHLMRSPVRVLLVEDSPNDAELMTEALNEGRLPLAIAHLEDGEAAMRYLRREGEYQAAARPDLILLDLHLPRMSGHEVLAEVKQDEHLRRIPVIMLTSSDSEDAVRQASDLYANCYVTKPADLDQFNQTVKKIATFWMQHVRLQPGS
jgi:two-component system, chemotaxis family, response regulator Rcp1